jgi:hypothetical protein
MGISVAAGAVWDLTGHPALAFLPVGPVVLPLVLLTPTIRFHRDQLGATFSPAHRRSNSMGKRTIRKRPAALDRLWRRTSSSRWRKMTWPRTPPRLLHERQPVHGIKAEHACKTEQEALVRAGFSASIERRSASMRLTTFVGAAASGCSAA